MAAGYRGTNARGLLIMAWPYHTEKIRVEMQKCFSNRKGHLARMRVVSQLSVRIRTPGDLGSWSRETFRVRGVSGLGSLRTRVCSVYYRSNRILEMDESRLWKCAPLFTCESESLKLR